METHESQAPTRALDIDEKYDEHSDQKPDSVSNGGDEEKSLPPVEAAAKAEAKPTPPAGPPGGPPPNGGLQAWLQVVGSWSLFFNTWVRSH